LVGSRNLAVVAGNGLSIACSEDLVLGELTKVLLSQLDAMSTDGSDVLSAVQEISKRIERDDEFDSEDFEKLVGAFDTQTALLLELKAISNVIEQDPDSILEAIDKVSLFTERVRDVGIGIVLQAILDRTPGVASKTEPLKNFLSAMVNDFDGYITFGNLNYDGLILSTMLSENLPVCDMASPFNTESLNINYVDDYGVPLGSSRSYTMYPLRTESNDLPSGSNYRIRLVHPHGSLAFVRNRETGKSYKIPIQAHRNHGSLSAIKYPNRTFTPAVVLTNASEKSRIVEEQPFKLAYEVLADGLGKAEHWLIAGYSFRDKSINEMLRKKLHEKDTAPQILVSTYGDALEYDLVYKELGIGWLAFEPPNILTINREGIERLPVSWDWTLFRQS